MFIRHYTSAENLDIIKEKGFIEPRSNPLTANPELIKRMIKSEILELIGNNKYLVGIPEDKEVNWINTGIMLYLLDYTTNNACLTFEIKPSDKILIRDYYSLTPLSLVENYGENLFPKFMSEEVIPSKDKRAFKAFQKYYNSTTKLTEYRGDFKVPEVWIPHKIKFG